MQLSLVAGAYFRLGDGGRRRSGKECGGADPLLRAQEARPVQAQQQDKIGSENGPIGLAAAALAHSKAEWNFPYSRRLRAHQYLQQELEAGALQLRQVAHQRAASQEKARHWILDHAMLALKRTAEHDGGGGKGTPKPAPAADGGTVCIPAGDRYIGSLLHCPPKRGQNFRRVLQVGVDDPEGIAGGKVPSMEDGPGEPALTFSLDQPKLPDFK